jgi:protein SCO1/2
VSAILLLSCSSKQKKLPYYGPREIKNISVENGLRADTIYHTIPDFRFVDQDSAFITPATFENKIYVADFFFTTCPTICPIMKSQMLRVYEAFKENDQLLLLSHSIDPTHDTVAVLKDFSEKLGVSSEKWHFVTGNKEDIYEIGQKSYMVTAMEDPNEPGGYLHSGAFLLVDKQKRIRGVYDGTVTEEVDRLIKEIPLLLAEYE